VGDKGEAGDVHRLEFHGKKLASVEPIVDTGDRMVKGDDELVGNATTFFSSTVPTLEEE